MVVLELTEELACVGDLFVPPWPFLLPLFRRLRRIVIQKKFQYSYYLPDVDSKLR